ncbi:hypothetical protein C0Q70_10203 [Pomacea canaliculata]|uniref:Peptidase S1 domain-containing protein n=1 Tax=Pomacea canaliculata TaxID=400727 RepID=A0A2T7PBY7_POMCA|nr:hypothetical protein C0Q70_10203 [Pomacea canaliculata]
MPEKIMSTADIHDSSDAGGTAYINNSNGGTPNNTSNITAPKKDAHKDGPRNPPRRSKKLAVGITVGVFSAGVVAVVVAVTLTRKGSDTCDLTPSHKKGNFQESDFLASVSFQLSLSPDLNITDSKTYNETLIGLWDWVSVVFDQSSMSSCFSFLGTRLMNNGSEAAVYLQVNGTCHNLSESQVMAVYEEGHNNLIKRHPRCTDRVFPTINVTKNPRMSSAIPPPADIQDTVCGQSQLYRVRRIVGGAPTHRGQYPWVIFLLINGQPQCGGSIWDYDIILTAAHCVNKLLRDKTTGELDTTLLKIIAGKWEFNHSFTHYEQEVHVTSGRIHANYDQVSFHNDIALLKLAQRLKPTELVMKVCRPLPTDPLPPKGIVAGEYDSMRVLVLHSPDTLTSVVADPTKPVYAQQLQFVELNLYNYTDCNSQFSTLFSGSPNLSFYLNNGTLCATNGVNGGKDSCQVRNDPQSPSFSSLVFPPWGELIMGDDVML